MKPLLHTRRTNLTVYIVLAIVTVMVAQGCRSGKACGCKGDLNSVYKPKRHYKY